MSYVFSNPGYISVGDTYQSRTERRDREKGKQFTTQSTKKDALFGTFEYKPEKYVDPAQRERDLHKPSKKITKPFRTCTPMQTPNGSGSYYGCIGKRYEHMASYDVIKKGERKKVTHFKRNIITNPPKKGTYGYVGTTLQKDVYKSSGADPYVDPGRVTEKEKARLKKAKKKLNTTPFRNACSKVDYFDGHKNVAASKVYSQPKNLPPLKTKKAVKKVIKNPWKPNSHVLKDNVIPYVPCPFEEEKKKDEKKKNLVFKPTSVSKSGPTRSIIFGNVHIK